MTNVHLVEWRNRLAESCLAMVTAENHEEACGWLEDQPGVAGVVRDLAFTIDNVTVADEEEGEDGRRYASRLDVAYVLDDGRRFERQVDFLCPETQEAFSERL